jgi:hypothetical protein
MEAHLIKIFLKPLFSLVSVIGVSVLLTSSLRAQLPPNPSNIKSPTEAVTDSVNKLTPDDTTKPIQANESTEMTKPIQANEPTGLTKPTDTTEPKK